MLSKVDWGAHCENSKNYFCDQTLLASSMHAPSDGEFANIVNIDYYTVLHLFGVMYITISDIITLSLRFEMVALWRSAHTTFGRAYFDSRNQRE